MNEKPLWMAGEGSVCPTRLPSLGKTRSCLQRPFPSPTPPPALPPCEGPAGSASVLLPTPIHASGRLNQSRLAPCRAALCQGLHTPKPSIRQLPGLKEAFGSLWVCPLRKHVLGAYVCALGLRPWLSPDRGCESSFCLWGEGGVEWSFEKELRVSRRPSTDRSPPEQHELLHGKLRNLSVFPINPLRPIH